MGREKREGEINEDFGPSLSLAVQFVIQMGKVRAFPFRKGNDDPIGIEEFRRPQEPFFVLGSKPLRASLHFAEFRASHPTTTTKAHGLEWHGWHAYRRGLTNLKEMGADDLTDPCDSSPQGRAHDAAFYIKTVPQQVTAAMEEFASKVGCAMDVQ